MSKKNRKKSNPAITRENGDQGRIPTDVLGSYTGMASDGSAPVQDADDL